MTEIHFPVLGCTLFDRVVGEPWVIRSADYDTAVVLAEDDLPKLREFLTAELRRPYRYPAEIALAHFDENYPDVI